MGLQHAVLPCLTNDLLRKATQGHLGVKMSRRVVLAPGSEVSPSPPSPNHSYLQTFIGPHSPLKLCLQLLQLCHSAIGQFLIFFQLCIQHLKLGSGRGCGRQDQDGQYFPPVVHHAPHPGSREEHLHIYFQSNAFSKGSWGNGRSVLHRNIYPVFFLYATTYQCKYCLSHDLFLT